MQYMLMIHVDEAVLQASSKEEASRRLAAYGAFTEALVKAGAMGGGNRLRPTSTATTVRVTDGRTEVLNGPYAETKEQLGGYFLIEAPDLDAAIAWAARCPAASLGAVEVRPVWPMEDMMP